MSIAFNTGRLIKALAVAVALTVNHAASAETLNLHTATIADINKAFASGKLSSEQLVSAYLKRIEAYEKAGPVINSFIYLNPEALAQAKALDAERKAGKVRGPSSVNGIVGLKPTHGLLSRDGIIPLALTFDTGGPMARSIYDIAISLNVMTGVDPDDAATQKSQGKIAKDYTAFLKTGSLKGARIGVARDFTGKNPEVDRVFNDAVATLSKLGATAVDITFPAYMLEGRMGVSSLVMASEFKAQITDYLQTTTAKYPKTFDDLVRLANDPKTNYRSPEKAFALKYTASVALDLNDPVYLAAKDEGLAMITKAVEGVISNHQLDAIVYPTNTTAASMIKPSGDPKPRTPTDSPTNIANQTGFPDLIVPAGMTSDGLPVTISFFGPAFSEGKLLGYGYDFEQATKALKLPKNTPALPGDVINL